jgi:Restriction endonuclease S subunits
MDEAFSYVLLSKEILNFTLREAVGSDQPFISTSKLDKWEMKIPKSKKEQVKIGTFLIELDSLITLHQRKLEQEKQKKKALMQLLLTGKVRCV